MKKYLAIILIIGVISLLFNSCDDNKKSKPSPYPIKTFKTGQIASYADGDDGDLQIGVAWPEIRFTDNNDGTITDNLTGLMWEQVPDTTAKTWANALTYANNSTLASYNDWRLPNRNEIMSLHNFSEYRNDMWLNGQGFTGIQFDYYWTSTTFAGNTVRVQIFNLGVSTAYFFAEPKTNTQHALICRNSSSKIMKTGQITSYADGDDGDLQMGVTWPASRFTDKGDGTVIDNLTDLMWQKTPDNTDKDWSTSLTYANDSNLAGYNDWRLPNYYELASLYNAEEITQSTWLNNNGFSGIEASYWTSTNNALGPQMISFIFSNVNSITWSSDPTTILNMGAIIVRDAQ